METGEHRPPRELPIIGGHLALDFANTVDDPFGPARHDHAASYPDLIHWAVRANALGHQAAAALMRGAANNPPGAAATLESAHQLRAALNDIFGAVADRSRSAPGHWTGLRPFVANAIATATLEPSNPAALRWVWNDTTDLDLVLHPIALHATELLTSPDLSRIKRCARCPWLFLDNSKNHSRRWCDMNDCGRAEKIERYVARRTAVRQRRSR